MRRDADATGLAKTLSAWHLVALGVGAVIGAGIFTVTGVVTAQYAGPAIAISFIVAAVVCGIAGLAYAEMAAMLPMGGSAYTYAYASFGELVAWVLGWALVLEYAIGNMAVASGFSGNMTSLFDGIGIHIPDALRAAPCFVPPCVGAGIFDLPAFLVVLGVTALLLRPVHENARVNVILVITKVLILGVFLAVAIPNIKSANFSPFAPFGVAGILTGSALIFFSFIGFDAVSTAAEETRNPQRDMPRGILGSLAVCTVLYLLVGLALTGVLKYTELGARDPLAVALHAIGRDNLALLMNVGGLVATLSVLLAFQLGTSRIFLNFARDGMIPPSLVKIHPKFRTPTRVTIFIGAIVALGAAVMPINFLVQLTNIGTLFAFALVLGAVMILRKKEPDLARPFRMPFSPWLPAFGIVLCLGLIYYLGVLTWIGFLGWMGIGIMIYAAYGAPRSKLRQGEVVLEETLGAAEAEAAPASDVQR